jgi:hypothetical protein
MDFFDFPYSDLDDPLQDEWIDDMNHSLDQDVPFFISDSFTKELEKNLFPIPIIKSTSRDKNIPSYPRADQLPNEYPNLLLKNCSRIQHPVPQTERETNQYFEVSYGQNTYPPPPNDESKPSHLCHSNSQFILPDCFPLNGFNKFKF